VVPDLAIDVTSPTDRAEAQRWKVLEYFRPGVRCICVVYPILRLADVYPSGALTAAFDAARPHQAYHHAFVRGVLEAGSPPAQRTPTAQPTPCRRRP